MMMGGYGMLAGGGLGLVSGLLQGYQQQQAASALRKAIRFGITEGQGDTVRQVTGALSSPEYLEGASYLRRMFGLGADPRADMRRQMESLYGTRTNAGVNFGNPVTVGYNESFYNEAFGRASGVERQIGVYQALLDSASSKDPNVARSGIAGIQRALGGRAMKGWGGLEGAKGEVNRRIADLQAELDLVPKEAMPTGGGQDIPEIGGGWSPQEGNPMDPLAAEFSKSITQAQMARGLYSSHAAAAQEASGMAAFKTKLQLEALPQLMGLGTRPLELAKSVEKSNIDRTVFKATGGKAAYGQPTAAAFGGNMAAAGFSGLMQGAFGGAGLGMQAGGLYGERFNAPPMSSYNYNDIMSGYGNPSPIAGSLFGG